MTSIKQKREKLILKELDGVKDVSNIIFRYDEIFTKAAQRQQDKDDLIELQDKQKEFFKKFKENKKEIKKLGDEFDIENLEKLQKKMHKLNTDYRINFSKLQKTGRRVHSGKTPRAKINF